LLVTDVLVVKLRGEVPSVKTVLSIVFPLVNASVYVIAEQVPVDNTNAEARFLTKAVPAIL
jgi:hypothetical protein